MIRRLKNIPILKSKEGVEYRENTIFPRISPDEDDIFIETVTGDRYDTLAHEFYNDENLWWLLAGADPEFRGTLNIQPGRQMRIPPSPERIVREFREENNNR